MSLPKVLLIGGVLLLIAGLVAGLHLAWRIAHARIYGIFDSIVSDMPTKSLTRMRCPLLLAANESGKVRVTVTNPSQDALLYRVSIHSDELGLSAFGATIEVPLGPGARWRHAWPVQASRAGIAVVVVQALADHDARQPGFHYWSNSFRERCGIPVVKSAFARARTVGASLGGLGLGVGLRLPWLRDRKRRRRSERRE